jgi:hypothetical protein
MKPTRWAVITGLVALNLLLAAGLFSKFGLPEQQAQAQLGRNRPQLLTVPGVLNQSPVLYVLDSSSGDLVMLSPNLNQKQVNVIGQRLKLNALFAGNP